MPFGFLKRAAAGLQREVKAEYGKTKDYLEACCAACALVANADGSASEDEKQKTIRLLRDHPELGKIYQQREIEACADDMFKRVKDMSGRQSLQRELQDIKNRPDGGGTMCEDVYLLAYDVANTDGNVDDKEKAVLDRIAGILGVDPGKFAFV